MDVILDSNIILEDPAFSGTQFRELFVYLKRTSSKLVIPLIVLEEVKARFPELVLRYLSKSKDAWDRVRKLTGNAYQELPSVDLESAVRAFEATIRRPGAFSDTLFLEMHPVELGDVLMRGIKRQKPASENGEELRDVAVWLRVKQYAREVNCEIAFISRDSGFSAKDTAGLHNELAQELKEENLSVSFHLNIAAFIKAHALKAEQVSALWLSQTFGEEQLRVWAANLLSMKAEAYGSILGLEIESLQVSDGSQYEIATNSFYVEATYKGTAIIRLHPAIAPNNVGYYDPNDLSWLSQQSVAPQMMSSGMMRDFPLAVKPVIPWPPQNRECIFSMAVSGRLENGKVVLVQVDSLHIEYMKLVRRPLKSEQAVQ